MALLPMLAATGDGWFIDGDTGDVVLVYKSAVIRRITKAGVVSGSQNMSGSLDVDGSLNVDGAAQIDGALTCDTAITAPNLKRATVVLTNAQIKDLADTPVSAVPTPGAGFYLEFVSALLELNAGANVLTETADNLQFRYENEAGAAASEVIECTGFIDQAADTVMRAIPATAAAAATTALANKPIVLCNMNDDFAGNAANDATLRVEVEYRVHAVVG